MKKGLLGVVIALTLCLTLFPAAARALTINYSNVQGASIDFFGATDTFTFPNSGTRDFSITSVAGSTDPQTPGLQGNIGGTFTIGAITVSVDAQTAPVSGTGTFSIVDEASQVFSANLSWIDIRTTGSGGVLNLTGTANLSNVTYAGANTDLTQFLTSGGANVLTFQFIPPPSSELVVPRTREMSEV